MWDVAADARPPSSSWFLQSHLRLHFSLHVWPSMLLPLMCHLRKHLSGRQLPCMQAPTLKLFTVVLDSPRFLRPSS